jgi:hypothetical protein
MVFAARMAEGAYNHENCPPLGTENKLWLEEYISKFKFDV